MWRVRLGSYYREIKRGKCFGNKKEELVALGFDLDLHTERKKGLQQPAELVLEALQVYQLIHGDMLVSGDKEGYVVWRDVMCCAVVSSDVL